jgi:thiol-disulfide isomerase/thioredoxin
MNRLFERKIVAVSFFNSDCAPCKKEIPELQKIEDAFREKLKIVLIASDKSKEKIQKFVQGMNLSLDILWDKFNDSANGL